LPITGAATLNSLGAKAEVAHLLVTRSPAFALRAFFGAENDLALRNNGLAASATNPRACNKQTMYLWLRNYLHPICLSLSKL
jgi:hypothetical protein